MSIHIQAVNFLPAVNFVHKGASLAFREPEGESVYMVWLSQILQAGSATTAGRGGNNLQGLKDFHLKMAQAKARVWA